MKKGENFVYQYYGDDKVYINLTNRCSNACEFCIRNGREGVHGGDTLWLSREPEPAEVIEKLLALPTFGSAQEFVFCGFGEPIYRVDAVREIGLFLKSRGKTTRINTNGQGNLIHGRNVVPELAGAVDTVSISLNAATPAAYQRICHSRFGEEGYTAMLDFASKCVEAGLHTILSVVDTIGEAEIEACRKVAASCGAEFRVRAFE